MFSLISTIPGLPAPDLQYGKETQLFLFVYIDVCLMAISRMITSITYQTELFLKFFF